MNKGNAKQWTMQELRGLYDSPLMELVWQAQQIHQQNHRRWEIQVCQVISVKTGGCPEDCKYCGQSARYQTGVLAQPMMSLEEVKAKAKESLEKGTTRICLSVAWRQARNGKVFDQVLEMVRELSEMGVEVCCTMGMLEPEHAQRLAEAGLYSYNHNLDTSESFYPNIITTHAYQERINTLDNVNRAGLGSCCGGIFGMGESIEDRLELIRNVGEPQSPAPFRSPESACADPGHTSGKSSAGSLLGIFTLGGDRPDRFAPSNGPSIRREAPIVSRAAGALFHGGGKFDSFRRKAAGDPFAGFCFRQGNVHFIGADLPRSLCVRG